MTTPTPVATTVLARLQDAWNAADGADYGAAFADDSDFVTVRGEHLRGPRVIAAGHQRIFNSIYRGSTVKIEVDNAREVAPGVVLAVATSTLDAPSGPLRGRHSARMTLVITSWQDGWRISGLHNTLVAQAG
jgi:uncharacterized protein (TIGR02246 family)